MNIFNTKKVRMEFERKIEESYERGKKDAISEALASIDKSNKDKKHWNTLTDKELMLEIMNTLSLHNQRLEYINDKIDYIANYKSIFDEMNDKIKALNESEKSLSCEIEKNQKQVIELETNANKIIIKSEEIDNTLEEILMLKNKLENMISDFKNVIPNLENACKQINNIDSKMNETINQYIDSPMEILNNLKISLKDVESKFDVLNQNIAGSLEDSENDSLYSKIESIESKLDSSFDEYALDGLSFRISSLEEKVNSSLDEYGFNSLYSRINELESKIDSINMKY